MENNQLDEIFEDLFSTVVIDKYKHRILNENDLREVAKAKLNAYYLQIIMDIIGKNQRAPYTGAYGAKYVDAEKRFRNKLRDEQRTAALSKLGGEDE